MLRWYIGAAPAEYVLTLLIIAGWLLLWRASRRARLWYAGVAPILAVLCLPLGIAVGWFGTTYVCAANHPECSGAAAVGVLVNGLLAFPVAGLLALTALLVEVCRSLRHRSASC